MGQKSKILVFCHFFAFSVVLGIGKCIVKRKKTKFANLKVKNLNRSELRFSSY